MDCEMSTQSRISTVLNKQHRLWNLPMLWEFETFKLTFNPRTSASHRRMVWAILDYFEANYLIKLRGQFSIRNFLFLPCHRAVWFRATGNGDDLSTSWNFRCFPFSFYSLFIRFWISNFAFRTCTVLALLRSHCGRLSDNPGSFLCSQCYQ